MRGSRSFTSWWCSWRGRDFKYFEAGPQEDSGDAGRAGGRARSLVHCPGRDAEQRARKAARAERPGDAQSIGYWRRRPPPVDHCQAVRNQRGWDPGQWRRATLVCHDLLLLPLPLGQSACTRSASSRRPPRRESHRAKWSCKRSSERSRRRPRRTRKSTMFPPTVHCRATIPASHPKPTITTSAWTILLDSFLSFLLESISMLPSSEL